MILHLNCILYFPKMLLIKSECIAIYRCQLKFQTNRLDRKEVMTRATHALFSFRRQLQITITIIINYQISLKIFFSVSLRCE